jgi:hypothetical protein
MFSKQLHAPEHIEIVYSSEHFVWQEYPTLAEERPRARTQQRSILIVGVLLTVLVLGNAIGISWLFSSVTEAKVFFIAGPH